MTNKEKFDKAIEKLTKMNDHHPSMVWYSEAKFLYSLIPELIKLLELGKQLDIDKLADEEDLNDVLEFVHFADKIVGDTNE